MKSIQLEDITEMKLNELDNDEQNDKNIGISITETAHRFHINDFRDVLLNYLFLKNS